MSEITSPDIASAHAPPRSYGHAVLKNISALKGTLENVESRKGTAGKELCARIREIGTEAEGVQVAAGSTCRALDALASIEEALVFALDAASEARDARSLPEDALLELQKQVDLAVNCVDAFAEEASFGKRQLFCGESRVESSRQRLHLPRLSSETIGDVSVSGAMPRLKAEWPVAKVEYSKSVASASCGGPNCLMFWADGATTVLSAGVEQVRAMQETLSEFYHSEVLPSVKDLAVTVANALASEFRVEDAEEVTRLLQSLRREMEKSGKAASPPAPREMVLRLLD